MTRFFKVLGIAFFCVFFLFCMGLGLPLLSLLFGWVIFPIRTLPQMTFEPAAFAVAFAALAVLLVVAHRLGRWFYAHAQAAAQTSTSPPWRFRWTASIVVMILSVFAVGIGLIVVIHETGWLLTSKEPIITSSVRGAVRRIASNNNLKQHGLAFHNYAQEYHEFPPGGVMNSAGELQDSWETMLLPYLESQDLYKRINRNLAWDHPENAEAFKTEIRDFQNPGVRGDHRVNAQGYGLSHYSVNSHVLGLNRGARFQDIRDGLTHTILGGEINDQFPPWGLPLNWRDPARGINQKPDGFGSPFHNGANFSFLDGSVRFLSNSIDPKVLQAISTPAGGEKEAEQADY